MIVATAQLKFYAPWVHSLKEKRMVVKSIIAKTHHKFPVSIAEVADQDVHQSIIIGIAYISGTVSFADQVMDKVISFIEKNTEAELVDIQREIR
jgi:uncharacterized protein YlxP (DUF503 family)